MPVDLALGERVQRVGGWNERLVGDLDGRCRSPREFRVIGGNDGDRFADIAHIVVCEHRLIAIDGAEAIVRHVPGAEYGVDTRHRLCPLEVDCQQARIRIRRAQRRAPQHTILVEIGGIFELAADLGGRIGPLPARADADGRGVGQWISAHRRSCMRP